MKITERYQVFQVMWCDVRCEISLGGYMHEYSARGEMDIVA